MIQQVRASKMVALLSPAGGSTFTIRGSAQDQSVIGAIEYLKGAYEPHVMGHLTEVIQPENVCIDVGANIGVISLVLGQLASAGTVYAFEASATNFDYLVENVASNRATNVVPLHLGLLDRTADLELCYIDSVAGCSFIPGNNVREGVIENIHCVSLDDWIDSQRLSRLDFIKLDAEGAEVAVLEGARKTLLRFRPKLVIEFNPIPMQRFWQRSAQELYDLLRTIYSRIQLIDAGGAGLRDIANYAELERIVGAGRGWEDLYCTAEQ